VSPVNEILSTCKKLAIMMVWYQKIWTHTIPKTLCWFGSERKRMCPVRPFMWFHNLRSIQQAVGVLSK
jgi:hypothetical protein